VKSRGEAQYFNQLCRRRSSRVQNWSGFLTWADWQLAGTWRGMEVNPRTGYATRARTGQERRRQVVLAGTSANTQRASLTLLVGRVVMVAMIRTANRQQGRQNAKEAKARRWEPEPNGYRTQKTAHSTQSSASSEGMAVFKGQVVQSLRPPRATGSLWEPHSLYVRTRQAGEKHHMCKGRRS
jgi:hypothetical protein